MKIIHVTLGKANPNKMNGVNKVVNSLAISQSHLGHEVEIWGITKNPVHNYPERVYSTVLFKDLEKFTLPEGFDVALKKEEKSVIFHIHGGFIPQFFTISQLMSELGYQYIYTPHGSFNTIAMKRSWMKKKIYFSLYEKKIIKGAKSIHFVGESEISGTNKMIKVDNYCLIPNGENIHQVNEDFENDTKKDPVFGFCGRLDLHTKGLDILLQGFSEYLKKYQGKGVLWMIGDGEDKEKLVDMCKDLNLMSKVKFLGAQYGEKKMDLFKKLDYLVLTSRNEGLPGVVLECAAIGVPSIVSKTTNVNKIYTYNAGIVLEENTKSFLAKAFQEAYDWKKNGKLIEKRKAALEMIEKEYDWKVIAKKLIEVYER